MIGMNFSDGVGHFAYDAIGQRYRHASTTRSDIFYPNGTQFMDQLSRNNTGGPNVNMTMGEGLSGICMPMKGRFFDLFSWTASARYNGSKVVSGTACAIWTKEAVIPSILGKEQRAYFSACIAEDGVPRELTQAFHGAKGSGVMTYRFHDVRVGDPGDVAFEPSQACARNYPSRPCEDEGAKTISVYRVWEPPEPLGLAGRDAGDVMGDLAFLCTQGAGEAYRSKLITHWEVEVSSAYGQYAMCNYNGRQNVCAGAASMLRRVGRRASQMQGRARAGGQCSGNGDIGSQYSFPAEALCPQGGRPSAAGCGWARARAVRTVAVGCVLERGLQRACAREFGHAPFRRSAAIFQAAFSSNDTSKGGCPDVGPHRTTTIIV